jgi:hypothetical protein
MVIFRGEEVESVIEFVERVKESVKENHDQDVCVQDDLVGHLVSVYDTRLYTRRPVANVRAI